MRHFNHASPTLPECDNPAVKPPRRRRAPVSEYLYVRRVKGGAWQARVWLGAHAGGSFNLGLFTKAEHQAAPGQSDDEIAEWSAARASRQFNKFYNRLRADRDLRATLEHLKAKRFIPADVLPPRVRRAPGGGYVARVKARGTVVSVKGVFACEWACYASMCAELEKAFPKSVGKAEVNARARSARARARAEREGAKYGGKTLEDFAYHGAAA